MNAGAGADGQREKQRVRERVWTLLESEGVVRFPGASGRIPNFKGAEAAAERLAARPEWKSARVIKANPDAPQLPVRARALADGKLVYMAVPKLADERPFFLLDPHELGGRLREAASIKGASKAGRKVAIEQMPPIDLVVCGSVAVNRKGSRIGKGGGYSDLELGLLVDSGLVDASTAVVTTVHALQVLDEDLPETEHDFPLQWIVTPGEAISAAGSKSRPSGILWDHLDSSKIASIPILISLSEERRSAPSEEVHNSDATRA